MTSTLDVDAAVARETLFETNYPEDGHLTDYVVLWNTYKRIAAEFSPDERTWVFEKTARTVYDL